MNSSIFLRTLVVPFVLLGFSSQVSAQAGFLDDVRDGDPVKVVVIGTSLSNADNDWHRQVENWLKLESPNPANVSVVSVGVGASSSDNVSPASSGIRTQLPNAIAQNPDAVLIEFSINDAHTPFGISLAQSVTNHEILFNGSDAYNPPQGGAATSVTGLREHNPNVDIVLLTMNNVDGAGARSRADLDDYTQQYRDIAQSEGYALVDLYPDWTELHTNDLATWQSLVPDNVHPTSAGEGLITVPGIRRELAGEVTFINGDFEQAQFPRGNFRFYTDGSNLGLWQVSNNTGSGNAALIWDADRIESAIPSINASSGTRMVTLQAGNRLATLSQTFDTVAGQDYEVTFDMSALVGDGGGTPVDQTLSLLVSAAGDSRSFTRDVLATMTAVETLSYETHTFQFTATGTSTTLSFSNEVVYAGDSNWGLTIDNVQLQK